MNKKIVFDIETDQFSDDFLNAKLTPDKIKYAPKMRLACLYQELENEYLFFSEDNHFELIKLLKESDEVISFNGKNFDLLVLHRHYGLSKDEMDAINQKHIDIHKIMSDKAGFLVGLDKAVKMNFNERKHTQGREMTSLNLDGLKKACKSDVEQTYRLYCSYKDNSLVTPSPKTKSSSFKDFCSMGPGHHMPDICPECGDIGSLEFDDWEIEDMSEGQFADYMAGLWGSCTCTTCGVSFDYGF